MNQFAKTFSLSACALAASLLISACGGGTVTDTTPPTVAITSASGTGGTATFTFTFNEELAANTFVIEDILVTGGTAASLTQVDATHFTLTVTPTGSAVTVSVAANKFDDLAHNFNTVAASNTLTVTADTVLASFDEATPLVFLGFNGAEGSAIEAGPAGGSGNAIKVLRTGGDPFAGAKVTAAAINLTTTNNTISARVYSPTAGTPMVLKLEGPGISTGDMPAVETVVVGWQTLTWVVPASAISTAYKDIVMLPNLGTIASVSPGETYFFDDFKLVGGGASNGGGGGGGGTPNPTAEMGSFGPVTLPLATAGDQFGFIQSGDGIFASDYEGAIDANGNHASWTNAVSRGAASNGNIGFFNDPAMDNASQKLDANGWIVGSLDNPGGVPNFFRFFVFSGAAAPFVNSWMGMFVNAPNNGLVDVSGFGSIKLKMWGPAEMYQQSNLNPVV